MIPTACTRVHSGSEGTSAAAGCFRDEGGYRKWRPCASCCPHGSALWDRCGMRGCKLVAPGAPRPVVGGYCGWWGRPYALNGWFIGAATARSRVAAVARAAGYQPRLRADAGAACGSSAGRWPRGGRMPTARGAALTLQDRKVIMRRPGASRSRPVGSWRAAGAEDECRAPPHGQAQRGGGAAAQDSRRKRAGSGRRGAGCWCGSMRGTLLEAEGSKEQATGGRAQAATAALLGRRRDPDA